MRCVKNCEKSRLALKNVWLCVFTCFYKRKDCPLLSFIFLAWDDSARRPSLHFLWECERLCESWSSVVLRPNKCMYNFWGTDREKLQIENLQPRSLLCRPHVLHRKMLVSAGWSGIIIPSYHTFTKSLALYLLSWLSDERAHKRANERSVSK